MSNGRKRPATFGNLRQWSDKVQQFMKEKFKLEKWFTVLKTRT